MTIAGSYGNSTLGQLKSKETSATEVGMTLLKKAQDQARAEASQLIEGITQAPNQGGSATSHCQGSCGQLLDTYA